MSGPTNDPATRVSDPTKAAPPSSVLHHRSVPGVVRVSLGRVLATPGALQLLAGEHVDGAVYLARHACGDWGDVDPDDWAANDRACVAGERILSAYPLSNGERLWIITEADRRTTTLLRPDEY